MKRYHVYLVASQHRIVRAASPEVAAALALSESVQRWPDLDWLVSDTEEELDS